MTTPRHVESDLGWALGQAARAHLQIARTVLADVPGGPRGFLVLSAAASGDPSTQLTLAVKLGIDRTVMTYQLDELAAAGLLERRPDPADRRARRIVPTARGLALLCERQRRLDAAEQELLAPLDPGEQDTLRTLLRRLAVADPHPVSACQVAAELSEEC